MPRKKFFELLNRQKKEENSNRELTVSTALPVPNVLSAVSTASSYTVCAFLYYFDIVS